MKILVVCQYYYPENFQINSICEQLVKDNFEVTVLTGLPNYPTGTIPDEYKNGHRDEMIAGVHVIRCYEIGRKKGPFYLGLNYLSFYLSSMKMEKKLNNDYDLVFCYQLSPIFMGLPARKYAMKHNVPMVLYCCDLWPESMKMYLKNENNLFFRYAWKISKKVYRASDKILCQSNSFIQYMKDIHGIEENKLAYLPAFADEMYLNEDYSCNNGIIDFVFLGNLGIAQDLINVLRAIELIKDVPGFRVHFVGDGTCLEEMKVFVKKCKLDKLVTFYGRCPVTQMPAFYKLADVCLVSLKADNQIGYTLPSKVQGYMAAGKPIIGMIDGSTQQVVEEAQCGVCVHAGDSEGLAIAMQEFIENPEKYRYCGANGRRYFINNFRKNIFMEKLEQEFLNVLNNKDSKN